MPSAGSPHTEIPNRKLLRTNDGEVETPLEADVCLPRADSLRTARRRLVRAASGAGTVGPRSDKRGDINARRRARSLDRTARTVLAHLDERALPEPARARTTLCAEPLALARRERVQIGRAHV